MLPWPWTGRQLREEARSADAPPNLSSPLPLLSMPLSRVWALRVCLVLAAACLLPAALAGQPLFQGRDPAPRALQPSTRLLQPGSAGAAAGGGFRWGPQPAAGPAAELAEQPVRPAGPAWPGGLAEAAAAAAAQEQPLIEAQVDGGGDAPRGRQDFGTLWSPAWPDCACCEWAERVL